MEPRARASPSSALGQVLHAAGGARNAAVTMREEHDLSQVAFGEEQKQNKTKHRNIISDTKTKDQFLPEVLRERAQSQAMDTFPFMGSLLLKASLGAG